MFFSLETSVASGVRSFSTWIYRLEVESYQSLTNFVSSVLIKGKSARNAAQAFEKFKEQGEKFFVFAVPCSSNYKWVGLVHVYVDLISPLKPCI